MGNAEGSPLVASPAGGSPAAVSGGADPAILAEITAGLAAAGAAAGSVVGFGMVADVSRRGGQRNIRAANPSSARKPQTSVTVVAQSRHGTTAAIEQGGAMIRRRTAPRGPASAAGATGW